MLRASLSEAERDFDQISEVIRALSRLRLHGFPYGVELHEELSSGFASGHLRIFEYTAAIIRAYTVFERLVTRLAEGWITWSMKCAPSVLLDSAACRIAYEHGMAEIFRRQTEVRFTAIDRFQLSRSHVFFSQPRNLKATLGVDAFVAQLPNLKIDQVVTLFSNIQLGNPIAWLEACEALSSLRDEFGLSYSEALKSLVEDRNEVAHGNPEPDETAGPNELLARIALLRGLVRSLYDYVISAAITAETRISSSEVLLGEITHTWPQAGAYELTTACHALSVGEAVLLVSDGQIGTDWIDSIQIEGMECMGWSGVPGVPLGVRMRTMPCEGTALYRRSAIREEALLFS